MLQINLLHYVILLQGNLLHYVMLQGNLLHDVIMLQGNLLHYYILTLHYLTSHYVFMCIQADPCPQGDDTDPGSSYGLFDLFEPGAVQGCCNNPELEENIKSETAVAGICGLANFANTCYMNSGLQCLFATPTVVKFFTECYKSRCQIS